jgi:hypothetical protein
VTGRWFSPVLRFAPPIKLTATSAGFPYRLDRLKPRASTSRGPLANVYNIVCHCHRPFFHQYFSFGLCIIWSFSFGLPKRKGPDDANAKRKVQMIQRPKEKDQMIQRPKEKDQMMQRSK